MNVVGTVVLVAGQKREWNGKMMQAFPLYTPETGFVSGARDTVWELEGST